MCSQRKSLRRASSRERAGLEAQHAQRARGLRAKAAGALGELDTALSEEARAGSESQCHDHGKKQPRMWRVALHLRILGTAVPYPEDNPDNPDPLRGVCFVNRDLYLESTLAGNLVR